MKSSTKNPASRKLSVKSKCASKTKPKSEAAKKLLPASVMAQKAWAGFPPKLKKELRKSLPDHDKDKVPDGFDCKPKNRKRQESFLPVDAAYLNSNPEIRLGKWLGAGKYGEVFSLAGNRNLVVKTPRGFANTKNQTPSQRRDLTDGFLGTKWGISGEIEFCQENPIEKEPLFAPTKIVNLGTNDLNNGEYTGFIRPKVTPIPDWSRKDRNYNIPKITDAKLEDLRRKIIHLSHKGYSFNDGFQLGMDKAGRLILYDLGAIHKYEPGDPDANCFRVNNYFWKQFLILIDRYKSESDLKRYGEITETEYY